MSKLIKLREAKPEDAVILSQLAMRSKAHWGYPYEFMEACRDELTITPQKIYDSTVHFVVAETPHAIVGFYGVEYLRNQLNPACISLLEINRHTFNTHGNSRPR